MAIFSMEEVSLYVIIGILAAIVYSLRTLFILEQRIALIDSNIQSMVKKKKPASKRKKKR